MSALYKVQTRYTLPNDLQEIVRRAYGATPPQQKFAIGGAGAITICLSAIYQQIIAEQIAELRLTSLAAARDELDETGRGDHLLNLYLHLDHAAGLIRAIWMFSDRDTALLFKLAWA